MKQYPSIEGSSKAPLKPCYAFEKYDGSNMRFEWSKKNGWYKFGCRRRLIDETDLQFPDVKALFLMKYGAAIEECLTHSYKGLQKATVFMEYLGDNSFAGMHDPDDEKRLVLIDVNIHKKGIIGPKEFLENFGHLDFRARVIHVGNLNKEFIEAVRTDVFFLNEGVVCKGGKGHKLWMCKIKTYDYLERLKKHFASDWKKYWE